MTGTEAGNGKPKCENCNSTGMIHESYHGSQEDYQVFPCPECSSGTEAGNGGPREWIIPAEWQVSGDKVTCATDVVITVEKSAYDAVVKERDTLLQQRAELMDEIERLRSKNDWK